MPLETPSSPEGPANEATNPEAATVQAVMVIQRGDGNATAMGP
ncbi:hypothetical protein [Halostagnicola sp. A-GB9-2]|nr:hypothetical protein [Halostagnicola sp. A-GB9-2]MDJ1434058.1 hypothetical protein [Halostagnicola sp. A-GB9-2]